MSIKVIARREQIVAIKEKTDKSGDFILTTKSDQPIARVVSVGRDIEDVKVGDRIIHKVGRLEVALGGEKFMMLDDDEVLAVIIEEA